MLSFEEEVDALVTAGLLTEQQAKAFVHRRVENTPRQAAAKDMGIAPSTLDNYVTHAERKLTAAEETLAAVDAIRNQLG